MKKYIFSVIYGILLTVFTVYILLDTFVIVRVYDVAPQATDYGYDYGYATIALPQSTGIIGTNGDALLSTDEYNSATPSSLVSTSRPTSTASGNQETVESKKTSVATNTSTSMATSTSTPSQTPATTATAVATAERQETVQTDSMYYDGKILITLSEYRQNDTTIYVADVKLTSSAYLKTALANGVYGKNIKQKTSAMAENNSAFLAVNGDFYGARTSGYVIRNGVLYRDTAANDREDLVIYKNGTFEITNEKEISANELLANGAMHVLSFGPALVKNGSVSVDVNDEVGQSMRSNPRTAIGVIDDLHYVFVVSDGRTNKSEGLSLYELAGFMQSLGVKSAYNLDGGGSSTMYFNGKVVNNPTTNGTKIEERSVSDIVYIGY